MTMLIIFVLVPDGKPVKYFYVLSELKRGQRIRVKYGFSSYTVRVLDNDRIGERIVFKNWYIGKVTRLYSDYNFKENKIY